MSKVAHKCWAIGMRAGYGIALGLCLLWAWGCEECSGEYFVDVNYSNTDTENIHLFVSGTETFDPANRVMPLGTRNAQYHAWFFDPVYWTPVDDMDDIKDRCEDLRSTARQNPQTWTFTAGRNGVVLATESLTLNFDDLRGLRYQADVVWDGTNLTVTERSSQ
jgi:hypothetical protein